MDWRTRYATELQDLSPTAERRRMALRVFLGMMLAALLSISFQRVMPLWAVAGVLVVAPTLGAPTFAKVCSRIAGAALGAFLGYIFGWLFVQHPEVQITGLALLVGTCTYLQVWGGYQPTSIMVLLLVMVVASFDAVVEAENVGDLAWARLTEFSLGVLVAALVNATVWPVRGFDTFRELLAGKLRRVAQPPTAHHGGPALTSLAEADRLATHLQALRMAADEDRAVLRRAGAWATIICTVESISRSAVQVREWERSPGHQVVTAPERAATDACMAALLGAINTLADRIGVVNPGDPPAPSTLPPLSGALERLREVLGTGGGSASAAVPALEGFERARDAIERLEGELKFALDTTAPSTPEDVEALRARPILPLDPLALEVAAKAVVTFMIVVLFATIVQWRQGVLLVAIAAFMSATTTLGAVTQRVTLRTGGALLGILLACVARVWIMPHAESLAGVTVTLAAVFAPLAYIAVSGPSVALVGFQAILLAGAGILAAPHVSDDIEGMLLRQLAFFGSAAIVFAVQRFMHPAIASRTLPERFARASLAMRHMLDRDGIPLPTRHSTDLALERLRTSQSLIAIADNIGDAQHERDIGLPMLDQNKAMDAFNAWRTTMRRIDEIRDTTRALGGVARPEGSAEIITHSIATRQAALDALGALPALWRRGERAALDEALARGSAEAAALKQAWTAARASEGFREWNDEWVAPAEARAKAVLALTAELAHAAALAGPKSLNASPAEGADAAGPAAATIP